MKLDIVTPEKTVFSGEVTSIKLPGTAGSFSILSHHAPLISSLQKGTITYTTKGEEISIAVDSGFAEVNENKISVCIESVLAEG